MKLYAQHLRETSTEDLLVILKFFDCDALRQHFTGLIADTRKVLDERGFYQGGEVSYQS